MFVAPVIAADIEMDVTPVIAPEIAEVPLKDCPHIFLAVVSLDAE